MSRRSPRDPVRYDYKVLGNTGEKVIKEPALENIQEDSTKMEELYDQETKLAFANKRLLDQSDLDRYDEIPEIEGVIAQFNGVIEKFVDIHLKLERGMGVEAYVEKYPDGSFSSQKLMDDWIRRAIDKIKIIKNENEKKAKEREELEERKGKEKEEREERLRIEKEAKEDRLRIEAEELQAENQSKLEKVQKDEVRNRFKLLGKTMDSELAGIEQRMDVCHYTDLQKDVERVRQFLTEYRDLMVRIETIFGDDPEKDFSDSFGPRCKNLSDTINKLVDCSQKAHDSERLSKQKADELNFTRENSGKIAIFEGIFSNLSERIDCLKSKCDVVFEHLTDWELLKKHQGIEVFDSEFNDILDCITELIKSTPTEYLKADKMLADVQDQRELLKKDKNAYKEKLSNEIKKRDITEEKMKNASVLGIKLSKFKGYDSAMDYYTFKSEFEKLIVPHVQAKLLPEYLKKNYLEGPALLIVKEIDELDEIWERLKFSFGDVNILLSKKLKIVEGTNPLVKVQSNDEKLIPVISKLRNLMMELCALAEKHDLEGILYHPSNLAKIYSLIGKKRQSEIMKKLLKKDASDKDAWSDIISYLDEELRLKEHILLFNKSHPGSSEGSGKKNDGSGGYHSRGTNDANPSCALCGKTDHVPTITNNGNKIINYFACEQFARLSTKKRFEKLKQKHFCFQCLTPGLKPNHGGNCFDKYKCPHEDHRGFDKALHILICDKHKHLQENVTLLEAYKAKYITFADSPHRDFSKNMTSFHVEYDASFYEAEIDDGEGESNEMAMYLLQTIKIGEHNYNLFYDNGCGDMVCKSDAVRKLTDLNRAKQVVKGPLILTGVNEQKSVCEMGRYQLDLPLSNGKNARVRGICLDKITSTFPTYQLKEIEKDIHREYAQSGGDSDSLPKLPKTVGGDTDIMLGALYLKWFPTELFQLPNGLTIYRSKFTSPDGSTGVVGGPHRVVTELHRTLGNNYANTSAFITKCVEIYNEGFRMEVDTSFLRPKNEIHHSLGDEVSILIDQTNDLNEAHVAKRPPKNFDIFEKVESAGTELTYRCVKCRGCPNCLKSKNVESISIQEEVEQEMIDKSVTVDLATKSSTAILPFMSDPVKKLAPNANIAKKVYKSVTKSLKGKEEEKLAVRKADKKLYDFGFNDYLDDLKKEERQMILSSPLLHFLPWRIVYNSNSISTPARTVYDASLPTPSGLCINDILPKGVNDINPLQQILLRWRIRVFAYHTDLQTMYNRVGLKPEHWCYQLYYYHDDLDPDVEPRIKVIKTLTFGLKPSGNQAQRAIRMAADLQKSDFPRESEVIHNDTYVDDTISGENSETERDLVTDGLIIVLDNAGFPLKGFTFSGFDPPEHLTKNGKSITVAGTIWYSKDDLLSLDISCLNFSKKRRGKKSEESNNYIPEKFTRKNCAGRVGEVYDLLGRFTPITAGLKLDLNVLCRRGLDWDDPIPPDLVSDWKNNFEMISKLGEIKFRRVIVPVDAVSLDMETIEMGDASETLACSALYVRFERKNGSYHCQLLFARSKILPKDMGPPRAELFAAELNATTGHIVYLALGKYITKRLSLTDSQITLFWICNLKLRLKKWPRNRVIVIHRLTDFKNWFHIEGKFMTADLGTRKGPQIPDVMEDSRWACGEEFAKKDRSEFPIKSVEQLTLTDDDLKAHSDELLKSDVMDSDWILEQLSRMYSQSYAVFTKHVRDKIIERYALSSYLIDPMRFRFKKVVRIQSLVIMFVDKLKRRINKSNGDNLLEGDLSNQFKFVNDKYLVTNDSNKFPFNCAKGLVVELSEYYLKCALNYFFVKASLEVKAFMNKSSYVNISKEQNSILYYTGRILPSQKVDNKTSLGDVSLDLSMTTFCVPLIDKYSPLAYAIINEVHWYDFDVWHSGNESVSRNVLKIAYIFEGRSVVAQFRVDCPRCHYLGKKRIDVAMGPVSDDHLCIAPAFFNSQVDIFGPFSSFSYANKRATIKIWFVIFCCCTTGAVDIKVMEDYSTISFILAFTRFSCRVGYPKKLLPDAGSQLVKGCETMKMVFSDVKNRLSEFGVCYEVCPVGAHYMHGKVERKIRHVKESFEKHLNNDRLSFVSWESLGAQVHRENNNAE